MSPFVRRALEGKLPVVDQTERRNLAGGTCPACQAEFASSTARNLHYMKRHADRRVAHLDVN